MRVKSITLGWAAFLLSPTQRPQLRWESLTRPTAEFSQTERDSRRTSNSQQCRLLWNAASDCLQMTPSASAAPVPLFSADYLRIYFQGMAVLRRNWLSAVQLKCVRIKDTHQTHDSSPAPFPGSSTGADRPEEQDYPWEQLSLTQ